MKQDRTVSVSRGPAIFNLKISGKNLLSIFSNRRPAFSLTVAFLIPLSPAHPFGKEVVISSFEKTKSIPNWVWASENESYEKEVSGIYKQTPAENCGWLLVNNNEAPESLAGATEYIIDATGNGSTYWVDVKAEDNPFWEVHAYRSYPKTTKSKRKNFIFTNEFFFREWSAKAEGEPLNLSSIASLGLGISTLLNEIGPLELAVKKIKAA